MDARDSLWPGIIIIDNNTDNTPHWLPIIIMIIIIQWNPYKGHLTTRDTFLVPF